MTVALALALLAQEGPSEAIRKIVAAFEKKDLDALSELGGEKFRPEDLAALEKESRGQLVAGLRKCPSVGVVAAHLSGFSIHYVYPHGKAQVLVKIVLRKLGGRWRLREVSVVLETEPASWGKSGKAKAPAAEVFRGFLAALEKKDWKGVLDFAPERMRKKQDPEWIGQEFETADKRAKGRFLETLRRIPAIGEPDDSITDCLIEIERGDLEADVKFFRENGACVIAGFQVRPQQEGKED